MSLNVDVVVDVSYVNICIHVVVSMTTNEGVVPVAEC